MKKFIFLPLVLCSILSFAQKTIAVQNNGVAKFYADWPLAWQNTQAGDAIYLPGGTYSIGNLDIAKRVTIIGVGHDTAYIHDRSYSNLISTIRLLKGADGTALHGFQFSNLQIGTNTTNDSVENITISRCRCTGNFILGFNLPSKAKKITVDECVLAFVDGYYAKNVNFFKCIFTGTVQYFDGNSSVINSILTRNSSPIMQYVNSVLFRNNIFRYAGYPIFSNKGANNVFENNILTGNLTIDINSDLNTWNNNFFNQPINDIFLKYVSDAYSSTNDYHLKPGSVGMGAGTDGYDIGIYGTAIPYKEGAVPFTPRIVQESVSKQTDDEGKININVKVEAQEH